MSTCSEPPASPTGSSSFRRSNFTRVSRSPQGLQQLYGQFPDAVLIGPEHGEHGNRDTGPDVIGDSGPYLGRAPGQEELVNDRIGHRRQRAPAVTGLPG